MGIARAGKYASGPMVATDPRGEDGAMASRKNNPLLPRGRNVSRRRPKTAFVLSGGASLGAIQVGMLQALYERDVEPDLIVGASSGALNGAFIAARPQTVATAAELADIWIGLRRGRVFPLNPLTGLFGFAGLRENLVPASGLRRLIARHLTTERLEQLAIPFHAIATDVRTGTEVRLSKGPLVDAILASAAIPGLLPSVKWDGRELIDGGVANNTPISHAAELGAQRIYVLSTGHTCELDASPHGALPMFLHAINLLVHRRLTRDIARYGREVELVVVPPPFPVEVQPMDFGQAKSLIDGALSASRKFLEELDTSSPQRSRNRVVGAANGRRLSAVSDPLPRRRVGKHVSPYWRANANGTERAKTANYRVDVR
jgi:NTE family protein